MTLRQCLAIMGIGTLLSWSAVGLMVTMIDPTVSRPAVFAVFYLSLLLALTGTFSLMGFVVRVAVRPPEEGGLSAQVAVSFRQALILALIGVVLLFMQGHGVLTWWNALLVVGAATAVESFFISLGGR